MISEALKRLDAAQAVERSTLTTGDPYMAKHWREQQERESLALRQEAVVMAIAAFLQHPLMRFIGRWKR